MDPPIISGLGFIRNLDIRSIAVQGLFAGLFSKSEQDSISILVSCAASLLDALHGRS